MIVRRLDANFDMTFGHGLANYASENEAIGQNVKTRLLLFLGEWFMDISAGMPWPDILGAKPANIPFSEARIRRNILGGEGVASIEAFSFVYDPHSRQATVDATVRTIYSSSVRVAATV
jgi:hypothetical protein